MSGEREPTRRQREVLVLVANGLTNKEIAKTLGVSVATVKKHLSLMMAKYGAPNRTALVQRTLGRAQGRGKGATNH